MRVYTTFGFENRENKNLIVTIQAKYLPFSRNEIALWRQFTFPVTLTMFGNGVSLGITIVPSSSSLFEPLRCRHFRFPDNLKARITAARGSPRQPMIFQRTNEH